MKLRIEHLLALLLPVAASCSHEEMADALGGTPIELTATLGTATRAANGLQTAFGENDEVGVYILTSKDGSTSKMTGNELFKVDGSDNRLASTTGTRYFFPTDGSDTFIYAYKPYMATGIEGQTFKVATSQTTPESYIASDLLWGVPETGNPVAATPNAINLAFSHQCAKLVVNLTAADGISLDGATLQTSEIIIGMTHSGWSASPFTSNEEDQRETITFGTLTADAQQTHVVLLVPQTIASGTGFVRIAFADASTKPLILTLPNALTLEAGKEYTLNITARRTQLEMMGCSIAPWNSSNQENSIVENNKVLILDKLPVDYILDTDLTLTGTTTHKITVAEGVTFTLKDATINNQIVCNGNATINLKGTNKIAPTQISNTAAVRIGPNGTTVTINGTADDVLEVIGNGAAGIGTDNTLKNSGNIVINGGKITAKGWPPIGCYSYTTMGDITINNGIIYAEGPTWDCAAIGNNDQATCGNIKILGGDITAIGGKRASAVGNGWENGSETNILIQNCSKFYAVSEDAGTCVGSGQHSRNFNSITINNCPQVIFEKRPGGSYMKTTPTPVVTNSTIYDRNTSTGELTDITDQFTN